MHAQLQILLEIQDLKTQRRELLETPGERDMEEQVFHVSIDDALAKLEEKIREMEDSLSAQVRGRYQRLAGRRGRVVVPVIRGTCYGCFVSVPTSLASDAERNQDLRSCENCGRFLYLID